MPSDVVNRNIRMELAGRRMSQADLAGPLNMSRQQVSARLSGKTRLTVDELYVIAEVLELPVEALTDASRSTHSVTQPPRGVAARRSRTSGRGVSRPDVVRSP